MLSLMMNGWAIELDEKRSEVTGAPTVTSFTARRGECTASVTNVFDEWALSIVERRRVRNADRLSYRAARRELCKATGLDIRRILDAADDAERGAL